MDQGYQPDRMRKYSMALSDQLRKHRLKQGLSIAELARRSKVSKGYLSQLENNVNGVRPSADALYKIAFALGTTVSELLEKQVGKGDDELTEIPVELRAFAITEQLPDEEIKMLARIEYRGKRPLTADDWRFLYEAIKRSVRSAGEHHTDPNTIPDKLQT
jgi:XRE family transcriptional regulator, master regulator for biofilm formation